MWRLAVVSNVLQRIVEYKKEEVKRCRKRYRESDFLSFPLADRNPTSLCACLKEKAEEEVAILAEIKKASPSKGLIRADFDPKRIAAQYTEAGATAISVLTDAPSFQGSIDFLEQVRSETSLPLLRKDFLIDPIQVFEAKAYGADAVLLIASILSGAQLNELWHAAAELGLECLIELYEESEFGRIDFSYVNLFGVNNRDLRSFTVDVHRGIDLLNRAPEHVVKVSESGLSSGADLALLKRNGIHAALIGEHFMRQNHPGDALSEIRESLFKEIKNQE